MIKITKTKKRPSADAWVTWVKGMQEAMDSWIYPYLCKMKPLSKGEYQKKEEKRRAKKITMTVGELEDKLEEARISDY